MYYVYSLYRFIQGSNADTRSVVLVSGKNTSRASGNATGLPYQNIPILCTFYRVSDCRIFPSRAEVRESGSRCERARNATNGADLSG